MAYTCSPACDAGQFCHNDLTCQDVACYFDIDCSATGGFICQGEKCIADPDAGSCPHGVCPPGQGCYDNVCRISCDGANDCADDDICFNFFNDLVCIPAPPASCPQGGIDCLPGQECNSGYCMGNLECNNDSDCVGEDICVLPLKQCHSNSAFQSCLTTSDCPTFIPGPGLAPLSPNLVCDQSFCVPDYVPNACRYGPECAASDVCFNYQCTPAVNAPTPCVHNRDCEADKICDPFVGSFCVDDTRCTQNSDCGIGEKCHPLAKTCKPVDKVTNVCEQDSECTRFEDYVCYERECRPATSLPPPCANASECDDGEFCDQDVCKPSHHHDAVFVPCNVEDDCVSAAGKQLMCALGYCQDFTSTCTSDAVCQSTYGHPAACLDGHCFPFGARHLDCYRSSDCNDGESCSAAFQCYDQACQNDFDCGAGDQVCLGGGCVDLASCGSDSDCDDRTDACFLSSVYGTGYCVPKVAKVCDYDADCGKGTCSRVCVPTDVLCVADTDCKPGTKCSNGVCKSVNGATRAAQVSIAAVAMAMAVVML